MGGSVSSSVSVSGRANVSGSVSVSFQNLVENVEERHRKTFQNSSRNVTKKTSKIDPKSSQNGPPRHPWGHLGASRGLPGDGFGRKRPQEQDRRKFGGAFFFLVFFPRSILGFLGVPGGRVNFPKSTKNRILVEKSQFFENEKAIFTSSSFLYNF